MMIVILVCISLMVSDIEHLFICLLANLYVLFKEVSVQGGLGSLLDVPFSSSRDKTGGT